MRIMLDTNILVSLFLFPNKRMNAMMQHLLFVMKWIIQLFIRLCLAK